MDNVHEPLKAQNIAGFPTIKLILNTGEKNIVIDYDDDRTEKAMISFLKQIF